MPLEWVEEYRVGIRELDEQHSILLGLVGEIARVSTSAEAIQRVQTLITRLRHYAKEHFDSEERLMDRIDHQGAEEHKEQHQLFMKQIGRFQRACRAGECSVRGEVVPFLDEWLHDHFLNLDMGYARSWSEYEGAGGGDSDN